MTDLSQMVNDALDHVEIQIGDFYNYGIQWRIGEIGYAIATIRNNTGLTLRNFFAEAHCHWNDLVPVFGIFGYNLVYTDEFLPGRELTMIIAMQAVSSGNGTVHIHFTTEFAQTEYDDITTDYVVQPD